ncbi:hypothetical protein GCM10007968_13660 [Sporolactobacillus putidus]|uniref:Oligosaccharide repeat unit polymerase n=2 Tax=Sporolactobacillus putidus TaxID=492735 RepID=A0A917S3G6_9BACL|nr:hypothetical protein GCM10007968_13660 [Sporolactobacillus putidus]
MFVLGAALPYFFNKNIKFFTTLDNVMTGRFSMGHYYINKYGISLFGHPIANIIYLKKIGPYLIYQLVDSAYIRILLQYGLVVYLIIFIALFFRCLQLASKNLVFELCIIVSILVCSFFERTTYNVFIFSTLLVLFINTETLQSNNNTSGIN